MLGRIDDTLQLHWLVNWLFQVGSLHWLPLSSMTTVVCLAYNCAPLSENNDFLPALEATLPLKCSLRKEYPQWPIFMPADTHLIRVAYVLLEKRAGHWILVVFSNFQTDSPERYVLADFLKPVPLAPTKAGSALPLFAFAIPFPLNAVTVFSAYPPLGLTSSTWEDNLNATSSGP